MDAELWARGRGRQPLFSRAPKAEAQRRNSKARPPLSTVQLVEYSSTNLDFQVSELLFVGKETLGSLLAIQQPLFTYAVELSTWSVI